MAGKIKIPTDNYPPDKHLYDVLMSQAISAAKLQDFLKVKGVFVQNKSISNLADLVCSFVYDHKELEALLSFTNLRENRIKSYTMEISAEGVKSKDVFEILQETEIPLHHPDHKVLLKEVSVPTFDKEAEQIRLQQPFKKYDYGKTPLLQEEDHQFMVTITPQTDGKLKVVYSTSNHASEPFYQSIKNTIEKGIRENLKKDVYIHEIFLDDLPTDKINLFFDTLLKKNLPDITLDHVTSISFFKGKDAVGSDEPIEDVTIDYSTDEYIADEDVKGLPVISGVKIDGRHLFIHEDVKNYRDKGYSIKAITAQYYSNSQSSSRNVLEIQMGFNAYKKFSCELKKIWLITDEQTSKKTRQHPNPTTRELYQVPFNDAAFEIYDSLRKKPKVERN